MISHYPNLLTSQFITAHHNFTNSDAEETTVIELRSPYWTQTPTIHLTASRMHYMIKLIDEMATKVKLLETQVQTLKNESDELKEENKAINMELGELRLACTAISEQEVDRIKKHFVDTNIVLSADNKV